MHTVPVPEDGPRELLHLPQGGEEERGLAAAHLPHDHGQLTCREGGQQGERRPESPGGARRVLSVELSRSRSRASDAVFKYRQFPGPAVWHGELFSIVCSNLEGQRT